VGGIGCLAGSGLRRSNSTASSERNGGGVPVDEPYVVGIDGTQIRRSSLKMPGTSWLKAVGRRHFGQGRTSATVLDRSVADPVRARLQSGHSVTLSASFSGQSCCRPGTTPAGMGSRAGVLNWLRAELDQAGRETQRVLPWPMVALMSWSCGGSCPNGSTW